MAMTGILNGHLGTEVQTTMQSRSIKRREEWVCMSEPTRQYGFEPRCNDAVQEAVDLRASDGNDVHPMARVARFRRAVKAIDDNSAWRLVTQRRRSQSW